jgi:predicted RNase H-like HicB family nuclease
MAQYRCTVVVEKDEDGYFAFCPQLQECYAQGATYQEALAQIRDAMHLHLADRLQSGEAIPQDASVTP